MSKISFVTDGETHAEDEDLIPFKDDIIESIREIALYKPTDGYMLGKLPGTRYRSQFYMSNCLYDVRILEKIAEAFLYLTRDEGEFQIAGRDWSSIPLLTGIPLVAKKQDILINSFLIRSERRTYGKHNYIEGMVAQDLPVMIVDAICNSTNAFLHCENVLAGEGIETHPKHFAVLNKYSKRKSTSYYNDRYSDKPCIWIVDRDEIFDVKDE
jgi:hypothetical protein